MTDLATDETRLDRIYALCHDVIDHVETTDVRRHNSLEIRKIIDSLTGLTDLAKERVRVEGMTYQPGHVVWVVQESGATFAFDSSQAAVSFAVADIEGGMNVIIGKYMLLNAHPDLPSVAEEAATYFGSTDE